MNNLALTDSEIKTIKAIRAAGLTLDDVWFSLKHRAKRACTLSSAISDYLRELKGRGRAWAYVASVRYVLEELEDRKAVGANLVDVTRDDVKSMLAANDNSASKHARLAGFFNWCVEEGLLISSPCPKRVQRKPVKEPRILSNDECRALLAAADDDFVGHLFLTLGLGLRTSEAVQLNRLTFSIGERAVIINAAASKTRTRRVVHWPVEWDAFAVKALNDLVDCNVRYRMELTRKRAGIKEWDRNCMRHTAASHWLNILGEDKAALMLGHSPAMLHRHYKCAIPMQQTVEWNLLWLRYR